MNHPMQYVSTNPFLYYKNRGFVEKDIHIAVKMGSYIGNDVWIGNNAVILPGVNIEMELLLQQEQWLRKMFLHMKLWVVFQLNI